MRKKYNLYFGRLICSLLFGVFFYFFVSVSFWYVTGDWIDSGLSRLLQVVGLALSIWAVGMGYVLNYWIEEVENY